MIRKNIFLQNGDEKTYEIVEKLGAIHTLADGYRTELNLISWNGLDPVFDIRNWKGERFFYGTKISAEDMEKMVAAYEDQFLSSGITCQDCADNFVPEIIDDDGNTSVNVYKKVVPLSKDKIHHEGFTWWLTVVAWNTNTPKFDIRPWTEDFMHMGRGRNLTDEDMKNLRDLYRAKYPRTA